MNITLTKLQSRVIAIATILLFFLIAMLFVRTPSIPNIPEQSSETEIINTVDSPPDLVGTPGDDSTSTFALKDFHRSEIKNGKTVWEVTGSNARFFPESNTVNIDNGKFLFFSEKDEPVHLLAGKAILYLKDASLDKAIASEGVSLNYNNQVLIKTDQATYTLADESIYAPGVVTIKHELIDTTGKGLHANLKTREMKLLKKVKSTIKPRSEANDN